MKALTLTQPWATLVALGVKRVETRSWTTNYRGEIAIHAARGFPREAQDFAATERALGRLPARVPLGAVVATARLIDVRPTLEVALEVSALERHLGDYAPGRWAWMIEGIQPLDEPIPARGALGLWSWASTGGGPAMTEAARYDVVEVALATGRVRSVMATMQTERNAEAVVTMAVQRRGVTHSFYAAVPSGAYAVDEEWRGGEE